MNTAIILAAGRGTRMNAGRNKQYLILKNKPILAHSIGIFQKCNLIDEIIVVINQDEEANCRINVIEKYQFNKVKKLVPFIVISLFTLTVSVIVYSPAASIITSPALAESIALISESTEFTFVIQLSLTDAP
jgi:NDP-sugar pyrophosphorylase family protein